MKTKKDYYEFADTEAREIALAMRPCIAYYSTKSYIKVFAQKRYETWVLTLKDKDIEFPSDMQDKVHKIFISTFVNVLSEHLEYLKKNAPKNPFVENVLKRKDK